MDILKGISMDVRQLISINEKLQSAVLQGTTLSQDETEIVRSCAKQLWDLTERINTTCDNSPTNGRSISHR